MTTLLTPSGIPITCNTDATEALAELVSACDEAMMLAGVRSAATAASPMHHEAGPAVAAAGLTPSRPQTPGPNRRGAVHPTTPLGGAVQPLVGAYGTPAPYYDCTTEICGASIELREK
jgi:hypothetical protein